MRVYTKTGDDGTSGLIGGTRVEKYDLRLESYGTVDELNSWIGLIRSQPVDQTTRGLLLSVQNNLFVIGARLATDLTKTDLTDRLPLSQDEITKLEKEMDRILDQLPPMEHFVLPGGKQYYFLLPSCQNRMQAGGAESLSVGKRGPHSIRIDKIP